MPVSGTDGKYRSGFISQTPRVQLRFFDDLTGSYPTIARTGDKDRLGKVQSYFDDTDTIIFNSSDDVSYPTLLHSGSKYIRRRVVTPHTRSDITTTATRRTGISDSDLYFEVKYPLDRTTSSLNKNIDTLSPFNDSRIFLNRGADFYATGTDPSVMYGFSSPLWSKTQISIDISPRVETKLTRGSGNRNDRGTYMSRSFTGFCYFNFHDKKWEQIGISDPADKGSSLHKKQIFDWAAQIDGAVGTLTSGTSNYPLQFYPSPQRWAAAASDPAAVGYSRVGTPTCTSFAPFATKYHATSSQCLQLSEYITSPFLLEKVVIQVPIEAQKPWNSGATRGRDMDNYVFFLYRQEKVLYASSSDGTDDTDTVDTKGSVTGSNRYIIGSSSICFYNTHVENESGGVITPNFVPIHTPNFKHAMGAGSPTASTINTFSDTITIEIKPAVATRCYHGSYDVEDSTNGKGVGPTTRKAYAQIFNYWPGGTTTRTFQTRQYTGKWPIQASGYGAGTIPEAGITGGSLSTSVSNFQVEKYDPRTLKPFGGATSGSFNSTYKTTVRGNQSVVSPYILFPEDQLVLGIDAGVSMNGSLDGTKKNAWNELTGSMLTMVSSGSRITLFGSLIREGVEFHDGLNQNLTSNALHESLHYDNPVLDQYNIESKESYIGTYIDDGITGSFGGENPGLNARRVMGSFASGTAGPNTGSLLRGVRIEDNSERFYDTLMPSLESMAAALQAPLLKEYRGGARDVIDLSSTTYRQVMPHPYASGRGEKRRIVEDEGAILLNDNGAAAMANPSFSYKPLRRIFFSQHRNVDPENGTAANRYQTSADVTGALSFNYGIYNIDPQNSSAVFRYDRFGQFRDVLEQRLDAKFYKPQGLIDIGKTKSGITITESPVVIKFVSSSTELEVSPYDTFSRNKSPESTSSIPYIDPYNG